MSAMKNTLTRDSETETSMKQQALDSLHLAWRDSRRMETLSDDKSEAKAAGRAVAFVDKAFAELERGSK